MIFKKIYNYYNEEELFDVKECLNFLESKIKELEIKKENDKTLVNKYNQVIKKLNLQIYSLKYTYGL
tara:strand:+ start:3042 stop:3242 length:201 start_codon:yes stop_codon:yes gene_type:complete